MSLEGWSLNWQCKSERGQLQSSTQCPSLITKPTKCVFTFLLTHSTSRKVIIGNVCRRNMGVDEGKETENDSLKFYFILSVFSSCIGINSPVLVRFLWAHHYTTLYKYRHTAKLSKHTVSDWHTDCIYRVEEQEVRGAGLKKAGNSNLHPTLCRNASDRFMKNVKNLKHSMWRWHSLNVWQRGKGHMSNKCELQHG